MRAKPNVEIVDADETDIPEGEIFLVCKVFDESDVVISTDTDAHGVATTSVKVGDGSTLLDEILLSTTIDGKRVPILPVSASTRESIYAKAGPDTPTLAPGTYVRLLNAEINPNTSPGPALLPWVRTRSFELLNSMRPFSTI